MSSKEARTASVAEGKLVIISWNSILPDNRKKARVGWRRARLLSNSSFSAGSGRVVVVKEALSSSLVLPLSEQRSGPKFTLVLILFSGITEALRGMMTINRLLLVLKTRYPISGPSMNPRLHQSELKMEAAGTNVHWHFANQSRNA